LREIKRLHAEDGKLKVIRAIAGWLKLDRIIAEE
jgi:hypothetical protein